MKKILYIALTSLLASCTSEVAEINVPSTGQVNVTSEVSPFEGEASSRINVAGTDFINGDFIRLKIICPFVTTTERGETTDGNSYDAFYYLKRSGSSWARIVPEDGFDISGTYSNSYSPSIASYYEAQQTPYVYIATTWSEERRFIAPDGNNKPALYDHLTPVFHADQSKEKHYRASDVLWAQTFMQTGAWNIHLSFLHKMACLNVTIDDSDEAIEEISDNAVLTLHNMPDIDQGEIVVGDYYADASKINSGYGYRQKSSCSRENNGKVLGIAVNDESAKRAKVAPLSGSPVPGGNNSQTDAEVPNTGIYTAYKEATKHYRIIVPPCVLPQKAVFWVRDGSKRYSVTLNQQTFVEGYLYNITLKLSQKSDPEGEEE